MPAANLSHPDRLAATLANLPAAHDRRPSGTFESPGIGAADCRIDLKLLQWRALAAAKGSEAAQAHLDALPRNRHPDLWAGTVQDGVARGFAVRLEEAIALAPPDEAVPTTDATDAEVFAGKQLHRKKDILVASGGARARFSRRTGVLLVDRAHDLHVENCLWFEARRDVGSLDGFRAVPDERPRLFSAQFLRPVRYVKADSHAELVLAGRLGRTTTSWPCRLRLQGFANEAALRVQIELSTPVIGWRLRSRFLGVPASRLHHACTPVREEVRTDHGGFVADTLVRSCSSLLVDGDPVDVPGAAQPGPVCHRFFVGDV